MIENDCKKFADKFKSFREEKGFNKSKMSALIGCDISYIGKLERGQKFPNLKMIFKIAHALEIPAKDLFDFD